MNPLHGYLESEGVSYDNLKEFVENLANSTSKLFNEKLVSLSSKIFDRNPEYYDDFYYFRNRSYSDMDSSFLKIEPLGEVKKVLASMEFDLSRVHFDTEDRKDNYPSPICFFVKIPEDMSAIPICISSLN